MSKGLASLSAALEAKPVKEIKEPVTKQDRFEILKHVNEQLNKQFDATNSLQVLGKKVGQPFPSISTGLSSLDFHVFGCGGVPRGRIIEVYGPESSGKTTITLHIIAEEQKQSDNLVAFIDAEHALDPNYAKKLGVNVDELIISQPDSGEQALETAIALVEAKAVSLIVIDSVAALVPQAELDGEMGDSHMGLQARLMSQAMRKLRGICAINGVSIIFINQIREKVGVIYGSPEVTTGGRALKFYSSVRLDIRRKSGETGLIGTKENPLGHVMKVKAVKNKMASPFHETEIDLLYGVGIDKGADFIRYAESIGAIEKAGAWYKYKGENIGQGLTNTVAYVMVNPELIEKIKADIEALRKAPDAKS